MNKKQTVNKKQVAPLRKVIGSVMVSIGNDGEFEYFQKREQLECGHIQRRREDIYGPTNAARRRCEECLKALNKERD